MALFGPRNGTNNAVSSSAHLGVHGRVVGSFLSLLTAVAFFSISVWTSGDVLVGGAEPRDGRPDAAPNDVAVGVAYGIFALLVLVVCIYGFRFMLLVNKIAVVAATVLFLLGIFAFGGTFDPGYAGIFGPDADAATNALYWPSFVGAALIVMSNPVSFGAFLGDWARYIPRDTPAWKSMAAAFLRADRHAGAVPVRPGDRRRWWRPTRRSSSTRATTSAACSRCRPAGTSCRCASSR